MKGWFALPPTTNPTTISTLQAKMTSALTTASIQAQRSMQNPIPHENLLYTFSDKKGSSLGCGDVGILHNIAIVFKSRKTDDTFKDTLNRFHIIVRTMRRSIHWDWLKPEHINIVLTMCNEISDNLDTFLTIFKESQQYMLEVMEKSVEAGALEEGYYLSIANGLKKPYEFITGSDFPKWIKCRADFYKSLNGAMPKINLTQVGGLINEHDGKCVMITRP